MTGGDPAAEVRVPLRPWSVAGIGLVLGPVLALFVALLLSTRAGEGGLSSTGVIVASVGVLMAVYWLTEAVPLPVTALFPIAFLPVLTGGAVSVRQAAAPYANEMIFLFMGGFMLALAMQEWGLHRRVALTIVLLVGKSPASVVLGFMLASAFLSMWISNTATVVMMLPIALSVIELVRDRVGAKRVAGTEAPPFPFATALLLGTAYAASLGGMATLVGTPPNLMMAAFLEETYGRGLSFAGWLQFGLPLVIIMLPITWVLLTRVVFRLGITEIPGGRAVIREELRRAGPLSRPERRFLVIFVGTALAWITRSQLAAIEIAGTKPLAGLSDAGVAVVAAVLLFVVPAGLGSRRYLLSWSRARELPWGILLLLGGGLSLAAAVRTAGVDRFIGEAIAGVGALPATMMVALVTVVVMLLTEMTSNTATTATFLPIVAATADGLGMDPLRLVIPATIAASCAFMMPVATPPNAIVFGSGEVTIGQMVRAGLWLDLFALVVIVGLMAVLGGPVLGAR